mmetsp:Transcript_32035/g.85817  ORF Transcript_32035/g.85817 Transcript_32035/m.85817 type:complete len:285 (+) Transcript_32035:472-1326(+)
MFDLHRTCTQLPSTAGAGRSFVLGKCTTTKTKSSQLPSARACSASRSATPPLGKLSRSVRPPSHLHAAALNSRRWAPTNYAQVAPSSFVLGKCTTTTAMSSQLPRARACSASRWATPVQLDWRTKVQHVSSSITSHKPSEAITTKSALALGMHATCGRHAKPSASRSKFPIPRVIGNIPPTPPNSIFPPCALMRIFSSSTSVVCSKLIRVDPDPPSAATTRESPALQHQMSPPVAATTTAVVPPCSFCRRADSWHSHRASCNASPGDEGQAGFDHTSPATVLDE